MNAAFIAAVVDTLFPGDSGGPAGEPPLPKASAAGIDLGTLANAHDSVLQAVANEAGSADAFSASSEPARIAVVQAIERAIPDAFRALLSALLADYYESPSVLSAMGWRTDPPQPQGNSLPAQDPATAERLKRVQARGKLWRG